MSESELKIGDWVEYTDELTKKRRVGKLLEIDTELIPGNPLAHVGARGGGGYDIVLLSSLRPYVGPDPIKMLVEESARTLLGEEREKKKKIPEIRWKIFQKVSPRKSVEVGVAHRSAGQRGIVVSTKVGSAVGLNLRDFKHWLKRHGLHARKEEV